MTRPQVTHPHYEGEEVTRLEATERYLSEVERLRIALDASTERAKRAESEHARLKGEVAAQAERLSKFEFALREIADYGYEMSDDGGLSGEKARELARGVLWQ